MTDRATPQGATARDSPVPTHPRRAAQRPSPQPLGSAGSASAALPRPLPLSAERETQPLPAPGAPLLLGGGGGELKLDPHFKKSERQLLECA